MTTTIGRIFFIAMLLSMHWSVTVAAQEIIFTAKTMEGDPLEQAGVGQPFLLEVLITNASNTIGQPVVQASEEVQIRNNGFHLQTINGRSQATYQYRARIDKAGEYTIGPVRLGAGSSNEITIHVGEQEHAQNALKKSKRDDRVFLRLSIDKQKVVVGQRLKATIRFYASYPVELTPLIEPDAQECATIEFRKKEGPTTGTEKIDGIEYNFAQWTFDIYPQKPGNCVIPAFAADYIPYVRHSSLFNPFGMMPSMPGSSKRVYSNAITLFVDPLPSTSQPIAALGHFVRFDASIDRSSARVGDGLLLKLELLGNGDWEKIKTPGLMHMPPSLKWYESKQSVEQESDNKQIEKKTFEYVVQAREPGTFTIPSHSFTFYDVDERRVKTLKTQPITLAVVGTMPSQATEKEVVQDEKQQAATNVSLRGIPSIILSSHFYKPWMAISLPWFIFIVILMVIFFGYGGLVNLIVRIIRRRYKNTPAHLFARTRKEFINVQRQGSYQALYALFVKFFADYAHVPESYISPEFIETLLQEKKAPDFIIQQWSLFFAQLSECVYYDAENAAARYPDLFLRAQLWLDKLKDLL